MAKSNTTPIAIAVIALGGGVWYYLSTQKDKTPVGLVVVKQYEESQMGSDADDNEYTYSIVEGTYRADENSLSVASESADKPIRVVFKNGEPINAELITLSEWEEPQGEDYEDNEEGAAKREEDYDAFLDKGIAFLEEYDIDATVLKEEKSDFVQTSSAESIFGPMLSLQSHFVW